jgi:hypothetical protein
MLDSLLVASNLFLEHHTGELAGMNNVILKPSYVLGTRLDLSFKSNPDWHNLIDVYGIYGTALVDGGTGGKETGKEFLELRGDIASLYTLYNHEDVLTFNTGPTFSFAYPLHSYPSLVNPNTNTPYANEENEKQSREYLLGWDFNINVNYDKSASSIHNIIYLTGQRIGPNLLSYEPVVGLDIHHEIFLAGTVRDPKLSLFANMDFWFARKAGVGYLNSHDGLGATKRELLLSYGVQYYTAKKTRLYLEVHGYNNLNRGTSTTLPQGFRDGFILGIEQKF